LVKENPGLKEKLASDADLKSFTDAVKDMGDKLVVATQEKAESATLDKAEAGIFALSADAQAEFDKTQLELK
jgi:2-oxo-4-hydroxy-4-carboxy--5-ureidoimidazoline (OHCU) decarboxylase